MGFVAKYEKFLSYLSRTFSGEKGQIFSNFKLYIGAYSSDKSDGQIEHHEDIPNFVLDRGWLAKGGWLVVEHPRTIDFSQHPRFESHREYGAVHFSFFTL